MPNLTASIPHQLSRAEAKRRIQDQIGRLRQQHPDIIAPLQDTWQGDEMDFSLNAMGQSVKGRLTVDEQVIHLNVVLPWFLSALAGTIKHRIEQQVRYALGVAANDTTSGISKTLT